MDLKSLSELGRVEEEREIVKGLTIKLHTLTTAEQENLAKIAQSSEEMVKNYPALQIMAVSMATTSINGEVVSKEDLEKFYKEIQYGVLTSIYNFYLDINDKQYKIFEEIKKK